VTGSHSADTFFSTFYIIGDGSDRKRDPLNTKLTS